MKSQPRIIVITGAESTGKSTLTEALATHFNAPFIPEIAREYIENLYEKYTYKDVERIAKKQVEQLNLLKNTNNQFIFVDTWLIITKIWFKVVFGKTPDWFESEFLKNRIDLFLVCDTDLPWIPDPVRENGGEQRIILHNKYIETIKKYNFKYKVISGRGEDRFQNALLHLKN